MSWIDPSSDREVAASQHVQVFIPSVDRNSIPIPQGQRYWVDECLAVLSECFGGATAFPPARGAWKAETGQLIFDDTVVVFSYASADDMTPETAKKLREFLFRLGREANQGEVGIFVDGEYHGFRNFDVR